MPSALEKYRINKYQDDPRFYKHLPEEAGINEMDFEEVIPGGAVLSMALPAGGVKKSGSALWKYLQRVAKKGPGEKKLAQEANDRIRALILGRFAGESKTAQKLQQKMEKSGRGNYPERADNRDVSYKQWRAVDKKLEDKQSRFNLRLFENWTREGQPNLDDLKMVRDDLNYKLSRTSRHVDAEKAPFGESYNELKQSSYGVESLIKYLEQTGKGK